MDWVHTEPVPRYPSTDHMRHTDISADTGSMRLPESHGTASGVNAWTLSGGSSESPSWEVPSHDWTRDEADSPDVQSLENNIQSSSAGGGASMDDMHRTASFVSTAIPERNGTMASPAEASFSPGRMMEPRGYSGMVGISPELDLGFTGSGEETAAASATNNFMSTTSSTPAQRVGDDTEDAVVPSRASKAQPKKKPSRPRTPKKKTKSSALPARRVRKVKKPHPTEVPLGSNGRERAIAVIRALVDSPLSDEFHKPVVQLHPEVRAGQIRSGWCRNVESPVEVRIVRLFLWHGLTSLPLLLSLALNVSHGLWATFSIVALSPWFVALLCCASHAHLPHRPVRPPPPLPAPFPSLVPVNCSTGLNLCRMRMEFLVWSRPPSLSSSFLCLLLRLLREIASFVSITDFPNSDGCWTRP